MRIIIAPDSFKGSLTALAAARAMERGIVRAFPDAVTDCIPMADGGEGTVDALVSSLSGEPRRTRVRGPLGAPVEAAWGLLDNGGTAVIEMAAASGLPLLRKHELDPLRASTFGTGELLRAALDAEARKIILGIGGSATNDGGSGFISALGARLRGKDGKELPPGGAALQDLEYLDLSSLDPRLAEVKIQVACDVDNPLCGPQGASAVYGPQKGADAAMIAGLDAALANFAAKAGAATGKTGLGNTPGAGAAGGLGAALLFFTPAQLRPGVELVLEVSRFRERAARADLVFTGEGSTDFQTAFGKAPVGVARAGKEFGLPVVCLSGSLGKGAEKVLEQGIDAIFSLAPGPLSLAECMERGGQLLEDAAFRICKLLQIRLTGA